MLKLHQNSLLVRLINLKTSPAKLICIVSNEFWHEFQTGTHSKIRHRWFIKGSRRTVPVKLGFQNFYVYSAIAPKIREDYTLLLPYVNTG